MFNDKKILLVDDDREIGSVLKEILEDDFKEIYFTDNPQTALSVYSKEKPDIVLSDINMPKMNGILLREKIKEINCSQNIILMTAYKNRFDLSGVEEEKILSKPINIDNLYSVLEKSIEN